MSDERMWIKSFTHHMMRRERAVFHQNNAPMDRESGERTTERSTCFIGRPSGPKEIGRERERKSEAAAKKENRLTDRHIL